METIKQIQLSRMSEDELNLHSLSYYTLQMAARMAPALVWCKQWAREHPPRNLIPMTRPEIRRKYRARKKKARGSFTDSQFDALCIITGRRCLRCGATDKKLVGDHVKPLVLGGSNTIQNIQPLCQRCNSIKKDKFIDYRTIKVNASCLRALRALRCSVLLSAT